MKRGILLVAIALLAGCSALRPSVVREFDADHTIHYSRLGEIQDDKINDYAVYLEKGDRLPVIVNIVSGIATASGEKINLTVTRRLYFRVSIPEKMYEMNDAQKQAAVKKIKVYTSLDNMHWASSDDLQAMKDTLGVNKGSITFGAGITKQAGVSMEVNIDAQ
jgi:hypothetical protein